MFNEMAGQFRRLSLVTAIALSFVSCGGGGGGNNDPEPGVSDVKLNGTASKGIIKSGVVTAEELNNQGAVIANVGSAITAADGGYNLALGSNYQGGPIQVSISRSENTEMKCDVPSGCGTRTDGITDSNTSIDFGEWYKPASITMTAMIPGASANQTVSTHITPFTHMAAVRAKSAANLDSAAISNANSEVSNLLGGIDILNTAPIDITDSASLVNAASKEQVTYAALSSALASQGFVDSNGQPDLNAAINLLASSFVSGTMQADDTNGDDAAQISMQEIVDATNASFAQIGQQDVTGVMNGLQATIDVAELSGGVINPNAGGTAGEDGLVKVKALMSDVRTWGNVAAIQAETPLEQFSDEVALATDALEVFGTDDTISALEVALKSIFIYGTTNSSQTLAVLSDNFFLSGVITSIGPGVVNITNGIASDGTTVNISARLPEDGTTASQFQLGILTAEVATSRNRFTIESGIVDISLQADVTIDYDSQLEADISLLNPGITDLSFDLSAAFTQYVDRFGNALISPVSFQGKINFDLDVIPVISGQEDEVLPKTAGIEGVFSNTQGDSFSASLVANVNNADTFKFVGDALPYGTVYSSVAAHLEPLYQWTYSDSDNIPGIDTFSFRGASYSYDLYWDEFEDRGTYRSYDENGNVRYRYYYVNSFEEFVDIFTRYFYFYDAYVEDEGYYSVRSISSGIFDQNGSLDGVLTRPDYTYENSNNWINADLGLTFSLQLDGLPEARFNINAARTGFESGRASLSIFYGERKLKFSVAAIDEEEIYSLIIANQDAAQIIVEDPNSDSFRAVLKHNGTEYGTITKAGNGLLRTNYTDGTFEIY